MSSSTVRPAGIEPVSEPSPASWCASSVGAPWPVCALSGVGRATLEGPVSASSLLPLIIVQSPKTRSVTDCLPTPTRPRLPESHLLHQNHASQLTRIIHEKCAIKAKPLLSVTTMRTGCLMKFFAMKSLAQVFGGLGRFRAVR